MDAISGGKNRSSTQAATGSRMATIGMPIRHPVEEGNPVAAGLLDHDEAEQVD